jgi:hypothetical protein
MKLRTNLVAKFAHIMTIAGVMSVATIAAAQPQAAYSMGLSHGRGDGLLRWDGSKQMQVERVELHLRRDGGFELHVIGRDRHRMFGTWSPGGSTSVRLFVENAFNDRRASGSGTVSFGRQLNTVDRIDLSGFANRSGFSLSFGPYRYGGPPSGPGFGYGPGHGIAYPAHVRQFGSGTVNLSRGGTTRVQEIDIRLSPNGEFFASFVGRWSYNFKGYWTPRSGNTIDLQINGAMGDGRASGNGTLVYSNDRRYVTRAFVSGFANGERFMAQFDSGGGIVGPRGPYFDYNWQVYGQGEIKHGNYRLGVQRVIVVLLPDGRFTSQWHDSRGHHAFAGTYTYKSGSDDIELRLTDAFGRPVSGSGKLKLTRDGTSFHEIELKSRVDGRDFDGKFKVR